MRKSFAFNRIISFLLVMVMVIIMVPTHFFPKAAEEAPSTVSDRFIRSGDVSVQGKLPRGTLLKAKTVDNPFALDIEEFHAASLKGASFVNGISPAPVADEPEVPDESEILTYSTLNYIGFYDISLYKGGADVQPDGSAEVVIRNIDLSGTSGNVKVIHILDSEDAIRDAQKRGTAIWVNDTRFVKSFAEEAALAESVTGKAGIVIIEELAANVNDARDQITFRTNSFSIYAVVDEGDDARLTVTFMNGEQQRAQVKITKAQYELDDENHTVINTIVFDPGVGSLNSGELFRGWTTKVNYSAEDADSAMTIDDVRTDIASRLDGVAESGASGSVTYYAMIFKAYTVTYLNESGVCISTDNILYRPDESLPAYTVNELYTPDDDTTKFSGWGVYDLANDVFHRENGEFVIFQNEQIISDIENVPTFSNNNLFLRAYIELGNWLVFDENGKGATYNAPRFINADDVTSKPCADSEMIRLGYTFGGWYDSKEHADAHAANTSVTTGKFEFGGKIYENTTIYASWIPNVNAGYTILIWKQNVNGTTYDFAETVTGTGRVGNNVPLGNTTNRQFTGFHLKETPASVRIVPEGTALVNVYYDRTEYTLSFQVYDYTYTATTANNGTQYGLVDGRYVQLTRHGRNNNYYWTYDDTYWGEGPTYTGTRYTRSNNQSWSTIKEIKALFEQNISNNFPIVGTNGVTYDNGERWKPQSNSQGWSEVMVFIETMPAESVAFHLDTATRPLKTMYYYVEALPTDTQNIVTRNGVRYVLYNTIKARYNGVTEEDFVDLDGFTKVAAASSVTGQALRPDSNGFYIYDTTSDQSIYFFYSRDSYQVNYMDGVYVDGNNNPIDETKEAQWGTSSLISYNGDISSFNKGGTNYFTPTKAGYVFEGWYLDNAGSHFCEFTTMPKGGMTVYAKWRQIQYRVFLHPNAGTDSSLDWGSESQQMNFRVSIGGKVDTPEGKRDDWDFIGWYLDPEFKYPFNDEIFFLNETTVTSQYNKETDFTDPMDKWGNGATTNADLNRFWITKKLDLYAKWRSKLNGARGIHIVYDANGGTDAPVDNGLYTDSSEAIGGPASKPNDQVNYMFQYWALLDWNGSEYVDSGIKVYPGQDFEVKKTFAKEEDLASSDPEYKEGVITKRYTLTLQAVYSKIGTPQPTHIYYDANGGEFKEGTTTQYDLAINETHTTLTANDVSREGYTFLGWAFTEDATEKVFDGGQKVAADNLDRTSTQPGNDESNILYAVWEIIKYPVKVTKTVDNNGLTGTLTNDTFTFNYTITFPSDYTENGATSKAGTITITANGTSTVEGEIPDVPYGSTVSVTEASINGYTVNSATQQVGPVKNENAIVAFTNIRDIATVTVTKNTIGSTTDLAQSFTFTAELTSNGITYSLPEDDASFNLKHSQSKTIIIPAGSVLKITEVSNEKFLTEVDGVETNIYTTGTLAKDDSASVTFNNTRLVTVYAEKQIDNSGSTDTSWNNFPFHVTFSDGTTGTIKVGNDGKASTVVKYNTVVSVEEDTNEKKDGIAVSEVFNTTYSDPITATEDGQTITVTNTRKVFKVIVTKHVVGPFANDRTFNFTSIGLPTPTDGVALLENGGFSLGINNSKTFINIPYGNKITISEEEVPAEYTRNVIGNVIETEVDAGFANGTEYTVTDNITIIYTNELRQYNLTVNKTVDSIDPDDSDPSKTTFSIKVDYTLPNGVESSTEFSIGHGQSNPEPIKLYYNTTYEVSETLTSDQAAIFESVVSPVSGTITGDATVTVNNKRQTVEVDITKIVSYSGDEEKDFSFIITAPGVNETRTVSAKNGMNGGKIVVPKGSTVTIVETNPLEDSTVTSTAGTINGNETISFKADENTTVTFHNKRNPVIVTVTKNLEKIDGITVANDDTYQFPILIKWVDDLEGEKSLTVALANTASGDIKHTYVITNVLYGSTVEVTEPNLDSDFVTVSGTGSYTDIMANTDITVVNRRATVDVVVNKTVIGSNDEFTFTPVATWDGNEIILSYETFVLGNGSKTITLPKGAVLTVAEAANANFYATVDGVAGNVKEITTPITEATRIDFVNYKTQIVQVKKVFESNVEGDDQIEFNIVVTYVDETGAEKTKTLKLKAGDTSEEIIVRYGSNVTVKETAPVGFKPVADATYTITEDKTGENVLVVTNERKTVKVTVNKEVVGTNKDFSFTASATLNGKAVTLAETSKTLANGGTWEITVPEGAIVTVTESGADGYNTYIDGTLDADRSLTTGALTAENTTVNFKNVELIDITFEKVIVNKGITLPVFESFFVNYTDAKEGAKTVELKRADDADDYKATVTVEYGTELTNITEDLSKTNASGIAVGTVYVPSYSTQSVPGTAKATVTITNTVKDYTLTVKKITDDGAAGSFALALATSNVTPAISDSSKSVTANDNTGVTYTLPYGAIFTLVENLTTEQAQYYSAEAEYAPSGQVQDGFVITGDGLITITNFRNPVTVTVTKTVVSDVAADFGAYAFTYTYTPKNGTATPINFNITVPAPESGNTSSGTYTFKVPAESVVTVTENNIDTNAFTVSNDKGGTTVAELGKLTELETSVTFTNTRKTFDLDVTKTVENFTSADAKYPVNVVVTFGEQTIKTVPLELVAGAAAQTITGIPYGAKVTLTEDGAATVAINGTNYAISDAFDTVITGATQNGLTGTIDSLTANANVNFKNTRKTVNATITKTLDNKGVADDWSTAEFKFDYTITDGGNVVTVSKGVKAGETKTIEGIPFGANVTVTEDPGFTASKDGHPVSELFTVSGDNGKTKVAATTAPAFEIVNTRKIVNVTIVKKVLSDDSADIKDYTFNVTTAVASDYAGTDVTKSGTQTVTVGSNKTGSVTFPIPAGTDVTIVETGVSAAKFETFVAIDDNAALKQLDASLTDVTAAHTVTYTNRKILTVTVNKIVVSGLAADFTAYPFAISYYDIDGKLTTNVVVPGSNGQNRSVSVSATGVAGETPITFPVPYGTTNLSVAEVLGNAAGSFTTALTIVGATGAAGTNNQSATVATVNVDTTITFTNTRKMQTITVEKTVDSLLAADLKAYTFTYGYKYYAVSGEQTVANATVDVTVSSTANPATATFEIPYDAHAFEISEPDNSGTTTVLTTVTGTGSLANGTASDANRKYAVTAKITADGNVSFTNRRVVYFDVRKILDSLDSVNDFTFEYKYTYKGTEVKQQITIEDVPVDTTGKAYAPAIEIPYGVEVTVTETTADGYSTFVLVPGGSASTEGVTGTAVITSGTVAKPAEFVFTNHRVIPFTIIKTVDSDETTPVIEYSFSVAFNYNGTADSRNAAVNVSDGDTTGDGIYTGTITIYIPYGAANVTVTETPVTGYDTEAEGHINGSPAQGANTGSSEYVKNIYTFTDAINKAADVAFVNTRMVEVTVIKELDSEETDAMTSTFNFNYTYTGTNHETIQAVPFTVKMPNALTGSTVIRVPYGVTLTVNELVDQTNYDTYYGFNGAATGTAGTTAAFANAIVDNNSSVKFSNKRMVNVKIIKNVDDPALSTENNKYTFTYTYTYNNMRNTPDPVVITVDTTSARGETGYFRIPYNAANFVVTETIDLSAFDVTASSTGTKGTLDGAVYTLSQNVTAVNTDITFNNQRMVEVEVVKKVESSEQADKDAAYSVTYGYTRAATGKIAAPVNVTGQTGTIKDATDGKLTVRMPYGSTFTVTETGDDLSAFQVLYSTTDNTALTEGKEVSLADVTAAKTVTFTNRKLYTVTVRKHVDNTVNGVPVTDRLDSAAFDFTYKVGGTVGYNTASDGSTFSLTNYVEGVTPVAEKVITLPYGASFVLEEIDTANFSGTGYKVSDLFTVKYADAQGNLGDDGFSIGRVIADTVAHVYNTRNTREITVEKTLDSQVAADFHAYTFNWAVANWTSGAMTLTPVTQNVAVSDKVIVPVGLQVTVTEDNTKPSASAFVGMDTTAKVGNGEAAEGYTGTVPAGLENVTVYFVNTRVTADLTITKTIDGDISKHVPSLEGRTFMFRITANENGYTYDHIVMIKGAGSVTISQLQTGYNYTVTEITGWSYEFDASGAYFAPVSDQTNITNGTKADTVTFLFVENGEAVFSNAANDTNWLRGEAYADNRFDPNQK